MPRTLLLARILLIAALVVYWGTIAWGTHVSGDELEEVEVNDKVLHFSAFLGLVMLMGWAFMHRRPTARQATWILVVAVLYGMLDEYTQSWIPGRHATVSDWLADCLGAATGMVCYFTSLRGSARRGRAGESGAGEEGEGPHAAGPAAGSATVPAGEGTP